MTETKSSTCRIRFGWIQHNEPEPDIAVLRGPDERYRGRLPSAADVFLLIEVADSSPEFDRTEKLALYAGHGIPELWIVNAIDKRVEQYRNPEAETYAETGHFVDGQTIESSSVENLAIEIADLLL